MARTWGGPESLPPGFDARVSEGQGAVTYELRRAPNGFSYSTAVADKEKLSLPVDVTMGGKRHGLGFLVRLDELDGVRLQRAPLIQARYFWSFAHNELVLAPGLSHGVPRSYETAIGLVLSPGFETRCLTCHGEPNTLGAGKSGGVRCESCHGPGWEHLKAVSKGAAHTGIINPKKLSVEESMAICGQCHTGFGPHLDAAPEDLLVANQVAALKNSECFIQSGAGLTCTSCHNAHGDSASDIETSRQTCLGCHSTARKPHAAICPVSANGNCIACHMPSIDVGPLHLVDHWIRVRSGQTDKAAVHNDSLRSQIRPLRAYLRVIVTSDRASAEEAMKRLGNGVSFYDVARSISKDSSAPIGGYIGEKILSQMDSELANVAGTLQYGQKSGIVHVNEHWVIVQRLARDFKWQAMQLQQEAEVLRLRGDREAAIQKAQQALMIYPHFLRALTFVGTTLAEAGAFERAANALKVATELYPNDPQSLGDLALVLGNLGRHSAEIAAYRQAIQLEPDFVAAYVNLGRALCVSGDWAGGIEVFRRGLDIDPLSAELYSNLGLALTRTGDQAGANRALALAARIDPAGHDAGR